MAETFLTDAEDRETMSDIYWDSIYLLSMQSVRNVSHHINITDSWMDSYRLSGAAGAPQEKETPPIDKQNGGPNAQVPSLEATRQTSNQMPFNQYALLFNHH